MSGQQPTWLYDPARRMYYWYDSSTTEFVYQNGVRIRAVPRHVPGPQQGGSWSQTSSQYPQDYPYETQQPAYSVHGAQLRRAQPDSPEAAAASLASLTLQSNTSAAPVPESASREYERHGLHMVAARNPVAGVSTVFATTPKERITDPALLAKGISAHRLLVRTAGQQEELYPDFRLQKPAFFVVGRVFRVLWAEPAGETRTLVTSVEATDDPAIVTGRLNQKVFSKVRRFVVVRAGKDYCSALPVLSYGHRGVGKPGVVKHWHAIIHTGPDPPKPHPAELPGRDELPMRPEAIRVTPDQPTEKLDPMSRIDFLRVHTVQHNIKAKSFGMVHPNSMNALMMHFSSVWLESIAGTSGFQFPSSSRTVDDTIRLVGATRSRHPTGGRGRQQPEDDDTSTEGADEVEEDDPDGDGDEDEEDEEDNQDQDDDTDNDGEGGEEARDRLPAFSSGRSARSAGTRNSQTSQTARQATEAIERLRREGYSANQALAAVMVKVQSDRSISREEAYRLLTGWTGYRFTGNSADTVVTTGPRTAVQISQPSSSSRDPTQRSSGRRSS